MQHGEHHLQEIETPPLTLCNQNDFSLALNVFCLELYRTLVKMKKELSIC